MRLSPYLDFPFQDGDDLVTDVTFIVPDLPVNVYLEDVTVRMNVGVFPDQVFAQDVVGLSIEDADNWASPAGASDEDVVQPGSFRLSGAYPNPFNPTTSVQVTVPHSTVLVVSVYDITGRQVTELTRGQVHAGTHQFTFDGRGLASGVYFVQAVMPGQQSQLRKITLLK